MLEDVQSDHGIVWPAEVVVDRVEPIDLVAARPLQVDERLGDVGAANRQPGGLELVCIPTRSGADLEDMTCWDGLGQ